MGRQIKVVLTHSGAHKGTPPHPGVRALHSPDRLSLGLRARRGQVWVLSPQISPGVEVGGSARCRALDLPPRGPILARGGARDRFGAAGGAAGAACMLMSAGRVTAHRRRGFGARRNGARRSGARRSERGAQEPDAAAKASRRLPAQEAPGGRALLTMRAAPCAPSPGRFPRAEEGRLARRC